MPEELQQLAAPLRRSWPSSRPRRSCRGPCRPSGSRSRGRSTGPSGRACSCRGRRSPSATRPEVAHARQRDVHQAVEELVHPLAAQRDHRADGHALAHLELRDRLLGPARRRRFWPVIAPSSSAPASTILAFCVASPRPMLTTTFSTFGIGHHVGVAELLLERRHDVLQITSRSARLICPPLPRTCGRCAPCGRRRASCARRASGLPHSGPTSCTFWRGSRPRARRCRP